MIANGSFNPIVVAKFITNPTSENLLFYGHYDVQPAGQANGWKTNPFVLTGKNGYLYARGVTDNKGPILAMIYAVSQLYDKRTLGCNVFFLIEGEEENKSEGLFEAIRSSVDNFFENSKINAIILSNSTWIDDKAPSLTFGLRGVIHATIEIENNQHTDIHSGVNGGVENEPLADLIKLLAGFSHKEGIRIPGFNDNIRPLTADEEAQFINIAQYIQNTGDNRAYLEIMQELMKKWRYPSFTIHNITTSGSGLDTLIPKAAKATVSIRIVPNQTLADVCKQFQEFVLNVYSTLETTNKIQVNIGNKADWWLGNIHNVYYKAASASIEREWGTSPLYIREGGSIPAIPWLEKFFNAEAVHIPIGQSSDNAHMANERISLENLITGRRIFETFLKNLTLPEFSH